MRRRREKREGKEDNKGEGEKKEKKKIWHILKGPIRQNEEQCQVELLGTNSPRPQAPTLPPEADCEV